MKKFFLSFFLIIVFAFYALLSQKPEPYTIAVSSDTTGTVKKKQQQLSEPARNPSSPAIASKQPTTTTGLYKDGEYVGKVADAYYGNVQVKVIVQNGKITDVQFLDYPQDRRTSLMISNESIPQLKQEAIQAQSANVDIVSGATETSNGFIESIASALTQAKNQL